jgi:beta-phosphoglucomutase-like phosphatase (HAD superfamily)
MVKAELTYNPYLLETAITFNRNEPKINSAVDKYKTSKLQNWVNRLPDIFYNEMNGWDFTLDFSGTSVDFEDVCNAFERTTNKAVNVNIIHKNELENAPQKSIEIAAILSWFESNPNRKFDFKKFREDNVELFDTDYPFVVYGGAVDATELEEVTVENITEISELENANLDNTPILFIINQNNVYKYQSDLKLLIENQSITPLQIFFIIERTLNAPQIIRTIQDIGINNPTVVESVSADIIKRYFEIFPTTDYIYQVIKLLQSIHLEINGILTSENEASAIANSDIHREIDRYEEILRKLKAASEKIANRDNYVSPMQFAVAKNNFVAKIANWRKRKIKMTTDEEADVVSVEFLTDLNGFFTEFIAQISSDTVNYAHYLFSEFAKIYNAAEFSDSFKPDGNLSSDFTEFILPNIIPDLIKLKEVKYVDKGIGVLGFLRVENTTEQVRQIEYSYQKWRDTAAVKCMPILEAVITKADNIISEFYEGVAANYYAHLQNIIFEQIAVKDDISAKLSDDERELQADNDWFADFSEKLRQIERS